MKILFASSEVYPLAKTGGLADVAGALPAALIRLGLDVRLVMPAYRGTAAATKAKVAASLGSPFDLGETTLLRGKVPGTGTPIYLIDNPTLFDRDGGPYQDPDGKDWPDNDLRFGLLSWAAAKLGQSDSPIRWRPDIVHAHDWQAGLIPAFLKAWGGRQPGTVFTIHNMAYQGLFSYELMPRFGLPWELYTIDGCEFWNQLSYLKAGLMLSDMLTTVSPAYAREIQTQAYGAGMEGVLSLRASTLHGILNGADYAVWDPSVDTYIVQKYSAADVTAGKAANKAALQAELGLPAIPDAPLLVVVSRLNEQKGMDLLLSIMPSVLGQGAQLAVLGSGDRWLEDAFRTLADTWPQQVAVRLGYSEDLAHRFQAGGDILLMPSRFEPCGLTQIYALRYGTLPVVHDTGGLADTVIDAAYDSLLIGSATGFVFDQANASAFRWCLERAIALYRQPEQWKRIQVSAMQAQFDWDKAAASYAGLYQTILATAKS